MYNDQSYLAHYGILGMKWGVRRDRNGVARGTVRMARKDAKRYADAKMFYGETAGTKRKLLKAELERKKKTIPDYEDQFNKALENVDFSKSAKKAVVRRNSKDALEALGVTGSITIAVGAMLYNSNREAVNNFISKRAQQAMRAIKGRVH